MGQYDSKVIDYQLFRAKREYFKLQVGIDADTTWLGTENLGCFITINSMIVSTTGSLGRCAATGRSRSFKNLRIHGNIIMMTAVAHMMKDRNPHRAEKEDEKQKENTDIFCRFHLKIYYTKLGIFHVHL